MTKRDQPGKGRSAFGEFAERLESGPTLEEVCTSRHQLKFLKRIATHASKEFRRPEKGGSGARLTKTRGTASLFSGDNGVGKTRAAAALGRELGLAVYRIDLSQVVNKYIGETEKNLRRLFDAYHSTDVILFFDEADALFGKRTEVKDSHDRYANLEIGYFLGRMEAYDGLAIMSARTVEGLNEAFLRRLAFVVEFPAQETLRKSR
jgi:SpoVK/Ycf46/Vps4 family AAA+-type ATPase